ncbi:hypothetical protein cyc_05021 [Cyclospora cayetanensis]|uniref:Uncharacterized protein n=1 Tax=Cyclospora cayetanensis TaxID=88456 RepID=A0A1D3D8W9_9EIME|nr:hypothetical protein cyc_05021 [Cyclospora cayetanensis]
MNQQEEQVLPQQLQPQPQERHSAARLSAGSSRVICGKTFAVARSRQAQHRRQQHDSEEDEEALLLRLQQKRMQLRLQQQQILERLACREDTQRSQQPPEIQEEPRSQQLKKVHQPHHQALQTKHARIEKAGSLACELLPLNVQQQDNPDELHETPLPDSSDAQQDFLSRHLPNELLRRSSQKQDSREGVLLQAAMKQCRSVGDECDAATEKQHPHRQEESQQQQLMLRQLRMQRLQLQMQQKALQHQLDRQEGQEDDSLTSRCSRSSPYNRCATRSCGSHLTVPKPHFQTHV